MSDTYESNEKADSTSSETYDSLASVNVPRTDNPSSEIGITGLIDKRSKLEEALNYVGVLVGNLKTKRTSLEKEIEEEYVDIKKLNEKLLKAKNYIDEEHQGIAQLIQKRALVEKEADAIGDLVVNLKDNIARISSVMSDEENRVLDIKKTLKNLNDDSSL